MASTNLRAKGISVEQLHDVVRLIALANAKFVNGHDSRMLQLAGDLRFPKESLGCFDGRRIVCVRILRQDSFDCNFSFELPVDDAVDHAPSAAAKFADSLVSQVCVVLGHCEGTCFASVAGSEIVTTRRTAGLAAWTDRCTRKRFSRKRLRVTSLASPRRTRRFGARGIGRRHK